MTTTHSTDSSPKKWEKIAVYSPFKEIPTKIRRKIQFVEWNPKNKRDYMFKITFIKRRKYLREVEWWRTE